MTDVKKCALIDASSAILLYKSDIFLHLLETFKIRMSASVFEEVTVQHHAGAVFFQDAVNDGRIRVISFANDLHGPLNPLPDGPALHRGERDTIGLQIMGCADFIIIDDGKGAAFCRNSAIPYVNALLCPKLLYFSGKLSRSRFMRKQDEILRLGRYSDAVARWAVNCSVKDLEFFLMDGYP